MTHPLVLELTGKTEPRTGLEGKFSVYHAAATALLRRDGSPTAFTDNAVADSEVVALRQKVKVVPDSNCHEAGARIAVSLSDGRRVEKCVERAVGSYERPLSNEQIGVKFQGQVAPVIGGVACDALLEMAWELSALEKVADVATATVPGRQTQYST